MTLATANRATEVEEAWTKSSKVAALVPAWNEEAMIEHTIHSLFNQSVPPHEVIIVANNCTDNTAEVARSLKPLYGETLIVIEIPKLEGKKAAALNIGFCYVDPTCEFVLQMDSDTILHEDVIKVALEELSKDPKVGGVGAAFNALPLRGTAEYAELMNDSTSTKSHTKWQRFLWTLQNLEYGLSNAWRVENRGKARVLAGACSIYRIDALREVKDLRGDGQIWPVDSLVEDYVVTLNVKDCGWKAKSLKKMEAWTEVPLSVFGRGGLYGQRRRWYGGTIEEAGKRMTKKHSREDMGTILWTLIEFAMGRVVLPAFLITLYLTSGVGMNYLFFVTTVGIPSLVVMTFLYRYFRYVRQRSRGQLAIVSTLVVVEAYTLFLQIVYVVCTYRVLQQKVQKRGQRTWT